MSERAPTLSPMNVGGRVIFSIAKRGYAAIRAKFKPGNSGKAILYFADIGRDASETFLLGEREFVTVETLATVVGAAKKYSRILPLSELLTSREEGVALVFEGGWRSHFEEVMPCLREYAAPATFFIRTAYVGSCNLPWKRKLGFCLAEYQRRGQTLPGQASLPADIYSALLELDDWTSRRMLLQTFMDSLPLEIRLTIFGELLFELEKTTPLKEVRWFMNWDEIRQIAQHSFSVGIAGDSLGGGGILAVADLATDFRRAAMEFGKEGVAIAPEVLAPEGTRTISWQELLTELGEQTIITEEGVIEQKGAREDVRLIYPNEEDSNLSSLVLCQLMGATFFGEPY